MKIGVRTLSTLAVLLATASPLAARAQTPSQNILVQSTAPVAGPSAGDAGGASGISRSPSNNAPGEQLQGVPLPTSNLPRIGLFTGVGRTLLERGIDIHGSLFDHFLSNTTTGIVPGKRTNLTVFAPAVDVDLEKLIGLPGGNVHVVASIFSGRVDLPQAITQFGSVLNGFQTTPVVDVDILSVLTYEQKLLSDKLSIEAGRTNVYHYFLLPNSLDPFTHFSTTFELDGDFNSPPYPVWGGRATYHFTPTWYTQVGAFADDFQRAVSDSNNFGDKGRGTQILGEIAQRSEFTNAAYPSNLELGFEWNTRTGYADVKGSNVAATSRNTATDYPGGGVIFFQGQKVLWRGARRPYGPPPNIALYGAADASVDKPQPIDMDALAGLNFTGLIPGRPFDALGLQAHYQRLSAIEANFESRLHNIFAGRGPDQSRNGYAFEVVANVQVAPWLALKPLVQYFVDPDNLYNPTQNRRISDGFEVGFFAVIPLGRLLGTSTKPF